MEVHHFAALLNFSLFNWIITPASSTIPRLGFIKFIALSNRIFNTFGWFDGRIWGLGMPKMYLVTLPFGWTVDWTFSGWFMVMIY
ncbi:MAG TPA: hypothetical protein VI423_00500 [Paenisporosarcina sp.]|nr:hypothetical protein [Paenisporosarcina sp.]